MTSAEPRRPEICSACDGTGDGVLDWLRCPECGGRGVKRDEPEYEPDYDDEPCDRLCPCAARHRRPIAHRPWL